MAGIGFELKKMLKDDSWFGLLKTYTYAGAISSGPWVLSILGIMLVGLMSLLPASLPKAQPDGSYLVSASRYRAGVFAFGGLAFLVAGVVIPLQMMAEGGVSPTALIAALGAPFGLAILIFAGRQMLSGGALCRLDASGIETFTGLKWRLAWRDISGIAIGSVGSNRWLMFETLPHVPDPPGAASALNRRFNMPPYALTTGTSGVDFNALTELAADLWEAGRNPEASA